MHPGTSGSGRTPCTPRPGPRARRPHGGEEGAQPGSAHGRTRWGCSASRRGRRASAADGVRHRRQVVAARGVERDPDADGALEAHRDQVGLERARARLRPPASQNAWSTWPRTATDPQPATTASGATPCRAPSAPVREHVGWLMSAAAPRDHGPDAVQGREGVLVGGEADTRRPGSVRRGSAGKVRTTARATGLVTRASMPPRAPGRSHARPGTMPP